ncbi:alkaline phosphatase [Algicola sagamiensis]|uniref:alkaline phosphatase n=1 Tax=Algicola sagamiensis TaxID=163869 RepID=UPI00036596DC|nr:alkaline phosphatase [Algicola sagamiensis]
MKFTKLFVCATLLSSTNILHAKEVKNIIYLIGDGMSPAYISGYRYYADDPETKEVETTIFDRLYVGKASTYPDDNRTIVTDSAAAATALSTGHKTFNGAISVNEKKEPLKTLFEAAKEKGKTTGVVVTSQINHATPASFIAHHEDRGAYDELADQYVDNKVNGAPVIDLMLGGGTKYFQRSDRDLTAEFRQLGYQYIDSMDKLDQLNQKKAMGLFARRGLTKVIDSDTPMHLTKMTKKALSLFNQNNENGFVLLIEGSQIDWCGHSNEIVCAMTEMQDFAGAMEVAYKFSQQNPGTLVVATADHGTGGLTLARGQGYQWKAEYIRSMTASVETIAKRLPLSKITQDDWIHWTQWPISQRELSTLNQAKDREGLYEAILNLVNEKTMTGWTTGGHTAVDVPVFSSGTKSELFHGHQDNTEIAKKLHQLL